MAKNKTIETTQSVAEFLNTVTDDVKRADSFRLMEIMKEATGFEPKMWGDAIVGFGSYHYKYDSGREGDAPKAGFSPRAKEFSLYLAKNYADSEKLIQQLGKHKVKGSCLYIKKLADINEDILREMITLSIR
ncbi:DUF1801 domain-containing protein [Mucilaginibacter sp.]|jgi:hypothetical protein|uniref:DUF1801 domain-containing protein n=1 Tax=Mucilaginibacter sp. TaxID=1882438 RepID=UPI00356311D5